MSDSLKKKTVKGVVWSGAEKLSVQSVHFIVMLIIANILEPNDFGLVGMLTIFTALSQSLIDSGFSQSLIRKQNRTEADKSTVFFFNIVASVVLYLLLFWCAPWVARFYNEPQLTSLMRVLCLLVIINSFAHVQHALYTASINFKLLAKVTLSSAIFSGGVGITLALCGYGVWTLVWQQISSAVMTVLLLWFFSPWRPKRTFSWNSFRELFAFGSNLMFSGILNTVFNNIYQIVIGKLYSSSTLGFFTQAKQISSLPSINIHGIIGRVTYPVLCTIQNDDKRLADNYRKILRVSAFIVFPIMCCLAGVSYPLIIVLLGDKWSFTSVLLVPLCFSMMWYPVHAINLNLLKVKGRSDLFLKLEIIKKLLTVLMLVGTAPFGLVVMCYGSVVNSFIALLINTYYTGKLIHVGFFVQMSDLKGTLFLSIMMFFVEIFITSNLDNNILSLFLGSLLGACFFIFSAVVFKLKELSYFRSIWK